MKRLDNVKKALAGTKFAVAENNDYVQVTCPWGNRFNMHSPDLERFGAVNLGMPYLEFDVPMGTAKGIAKFYRKIFGAQTCVEGKGPDRVARVGVGHNQEFRFRQKKGEQAPYDGHHIQVYVQDFSGPYEELKKRDLLTEESNAYQYRWERIVDVDSDETLFEIEHEVRSMTHPLYARPLVNRNPMQSQQSYEMEGDDWIPQTRISNPRLPDVPEFTWPRAQPLKDRRAARMARGCEDIPGRKEVLGRAWPEPSTSSVPSLADKDVAPRNKPGGGVSAEASANPGWVDCQVTICHLPPLLA